MIGPNDIVVNGFAGAGFIGTIFFAGYWFRQWISDRADKK